MISTEVLQGMDKIMETLGNVIIKLFVLVALKEHYCLVIILFVYAV
jgi:hypothetical protein